MIESIAAIHRRIFIPQAQAFQITRIDLDIR